MKKLMIASRKKIVRNVYIPLDLIIKLLTIGNALVYGYTSSAIVLGSIFLVWSGITLGVSMLGIVLGGFVNKLEVTFILENLGTILDAKPFAAILLAILLLGNLWVLTHYLEKDIRTSGAVIGSAYVLVWGVTCTCVVYNIFGYFGLLPLIGAFSVSLSRIAIGTGLFVYGHSGIFVRSFWTFTEDFRDGLILVWQGLRFRNWDRRTKYYFYNTVLLMAFFGLATTHQEVYLMASPDTWEDLFKVLKFQDVATKDQSWRDIPINQLIGDRGEIKISLQEATPEQVKRILYYKLSESPEALAAAGYGIWHVVMGFLGGIGTGLSLYFLFKGGGGGPPPPPPPSGGGDAVVPKGNPLPSEREATGEGSTVALPIVAPVENKDATEAPVENEVPIVAPVENKDATEAPVENEVPIVAPVENRGPIVAPGENKVPIVAPVENLGPIVAPGENKVPMVSNSMEGEFLVLFEAPSAPITREEGRIEANVFIAGSDKRAEEARGFSGENSSKDVESLTSLDEIGATGEASTLALPIVAPVENKVPIEGIVENRVFPTFLEIGELGKKNFYSPEEQEILDAQASEREKIWLSVIATWEGNFSVDVNDNVHREHDFFLEFGKYAEIHEKLAAEVLFLDMQALYEKLVEFLTKEEQAYESKFPKKVWYRLDEFFPKLVNWREAAKDLDKKRLLPSIACEIENLKGYFKITRSSMKPEDKMVYDVLLKDSQTKEARYYVCQYYIDVKSMDASRI